MLHWIQNWLKLDLTPFILVEHMECCALCVLGTRAQVRQDESSCNGTDGMLVWGVALIETSWLLLFRKMWVQCGTVLLLFAIDGHIIGSKEKIRALSQSIIKIYRLQFFSHSLDNSDGIFITVILIHQGVVVVCVFFFYLCFSITTFIFAINLYFKLNN